MAESIVISYAILLGFVAVVLYKINAPREEKPETIEDLEKVSDD
jgi:hypothetical protein